MGKRHHFVASFYLDRFVDPANPPYLWIYDKQDAEIHRASARDAGLHKHFYSFPKLDGTRDSDSFEQAAGAIESQAAPPIQKILCREVLDDDERSAVSLFMALTITRVPAFRENLHQHAAAAVKATGMVFAQHEEFLEKFIADRKSKGEDVPIDKLKESAALLREGKFDVEMLPHYSLPFILTLALDLAPLFHNMNWVFITRQDTYRFVTSDNPLTYIDPTHTQDPIAGVGLGNPNIEVTLPLSSDMALVACWKDVTSTYQRGTNPLVKEINYRTISNAERFVYASAHDEGIAKLVKKHRDTAPKAKITTIPTSNGYLVGATFNPPVQPRPALVSTFSSSDAVRRRAIKEATMGRYTKEIYARKSTEQRDMKGGDDGHAL